MGHYAGNFKARSFLGPFARRSHFPKTLRGKTAVNPLCMKSDFVETVPKPTTESAMLLPLMGLHYLRVVKGMQSERDSPDTRRLMLSLDLTGQSGAEHARNLERMLNHENTLSLLLKEFSPARVKAISAMLLQGRTENEKAELIRKYPQNFHGAAPLKSPAKKKS